MKWIPKHIAIQMMGLKPSSFYNFSCSKLHREYFKVLEQGSNGASYKYTHVREDFIKLYNRRKNVSHVYDALLDYYGGEMAVRRLLLTKYDISMDSSRRMLTYIYCEVEKVNIHSSIMCLYDLYKATFGREWDK